MMRLGSGEKSLPGVTGGEPLHHELTALCQSLASTGLPLHLHLETSGVERWHPTASA
jgi:organic radical activating enzyme